MARIKEGSVILTSNGPKLIAILDDITAQRAGAVISIDGVSNAGGNIDLVAGANIAITPDDANNKITIAGTGTWPNADTVDGAHAGTAANNVLKLDASGKVPLGNIPAHKSTHASGGSDVLTPSDIGAATTTVYTATLDTTWSGATAPYSKTVTVTGISATDTPIVDVVMSGTYTTDEARIEAWGYIYRITTAANSITLYATDKPTVSLPIQIKVVR